MRARALSIFHSIFQDWHQYTWWTASIVSVLALDVLLTISDPPPSVKAELAARDSSKKERLPAAISPTVVTESLGGPRGLQAVELTVPCEDKKSDFENAVSQVRITGQACKGRREIDSVEVLNDANGFSATVFFTDARSFTTDYVTLIPGENKIRILVVYKNGEREERAHLIQRAL